jgi:hypothetical protein
VDEGFGPLTLVREREREAELRLAFGPSMELDRGQSRAAIGIFVCRGEVLAQSRPSAEGASQQPFSRAVHALREHDDLILRSHIAPSAMGRADLTFRERARAPRGCVHHAAQRVLDASRRDPHVDDVCLEAGLA